MGKGVELVTPHVAPVVEISATEFVKSGDVWERKNVVRFGMAGGRRDGLSVLFAEVN